jgi:hypothetical protein
LRIILCGCLVRGCGEPLNRQKHPYYEHRRRILPRQTRGSM